MTRFEKVMEKAIVEINECTKQVKKISEGRELRAKTINLLEISNQNLEQILEQTKRLDKAIAQKLKEAGK